MGRLTGVRKRATKRDAAIPLLAMAMSVGCANVDPAQVASLTCMAGSMLAVAGDNFGKAYLSNAATMMSAFAGVQYGQVGCGNPRAYAGSAGGYPNSQYPQAGQGYPPPQQYPDTGQSYPPPQQYPDTGQSYPPPAYETTRRGATAAPSLDVGLFRQVRRDGGTEPALLKSGEVLSGERGDVFQIYVSPSAPTYLYVYAVDATGWIQQLHPSGPASDVSLPAGGELFLPGRDQFYGLDDVPGVQQIFVMASRLARPDVEAQLARFPLGRARPASELRTRSGEPGYESVTQATVLARGLRRAVAADVRIPNASGESFELKTPRFLLNPENGSAVFSMWFRVE